MSDVTGPAERIGAAADRVRLDLAAAAWMVFLLGGVAVSVYAALWPPQQGLGGGWAKAQLLAESGRSFLAIGCFVGLGLAALFDGPAAPAARALAVLGGAWALVAGVIGVVVAQHVDPVFGAQSRELRVLGVLSYLMSAGLGLVVLVVALRSAGSSSPRARGRAEVAEVS